MGTNYIYKVAGDAAALVLSDAEFLAEAQRIIGHQPGIARADFANKMAKQSSFIAEAVAQFIATYASVDVQDDQATALVVANLVTAITSMIPEGELESAGFIKPFGGATPPAGFLECNGASLLRTSYADLFAAIGFAWGAVDGTHFNIPDLRGRFPRCWDHGVGRDPDKATRTACNAGGNTGDNVGTVQPSANKSHLHSASGTISSDGWGHYTGPLPHGYSHNNFMSDYNFAREEMINNASIGVTVAAAGDVESRPINANVLYCIKY